MKKFLLVSFLFTSTMLGIAAQQDCNTAIPVCNDATFAGNSSGFGVQELSNNTFNGCLDGEENQTTWFGFSPQVTGTIEFVITPTAGAIDYDFAVWGPFPAGTGCPIATAPLRCSFAAQTGATGLQNGAGDNTEGASPAMTPRFVENIDVLAANVGMVYYLCVDNFTANTTPFTLDWTLSPLNILDCTPPLPVSLIHFEAYPFDDKNEVFWSTASETNSAYFIIESSADGINYHEVGRVTAAGNSNNFKEYTLLDPNPYPTTYYKLHQIDMNGDSKIYGPTVVMNDKAKDVQVHEVFPNPAEEFFNVDIFTKEPTPLDLSIYDSFGKLIYNQQVVANGTWTYTVQSSGWSSGIYYVKIINEAEQINEVRKVVIH